MSSRTMSRGSGWITAGPMSLIVAVSLLPRMHDSKGLSGGLQLSAAVRQLGLLRLSGGTPNVSGFSNGGWSKAPFSFRLPGASCPSKWLAPPVATLRYPLTSDYTLWSAWLGIDPSSEGSGSANSAAGALSIAGRAFFGWTNGSAFRGGLPFVSIRTTWVKFVSLGSRMFPAGSVKCSSCEWGTIYAFVPWSVVD